MVDRSERIIFGLLYAWCVWSFGQALFKIPNVVTLLYLADQTLVLVFLLTRRPAGRISAHPLDIAAAAGATALPLLASPPSGEPLIPPAACSMLMLIGIALHLGAKLSLRRSFGIVPADRGIKSSGLYGLVRHPMYLGYMFTHVGLLLAGPLAWNVAVFGLCWMLFLYRIHAEEKLLTSNDDYRAFQKKTRFRLIPGLY